MKTSSNPRWEPYLPFGRESHTSVIGTRQEGATLKLLELETLKSTLAKKFRGGTFAKTRGRPIVSFIDTLLCATTSANPTTIASRRYE